MNRIGLLAIDRTGAIGLPGIDRAVVEHWIPFSRLKNGRGLWRFDEIAAE
jgi:hypothetical protein